MNHKVATDYWYELMLLDESIHRTVGAVGKACYQYEFGEIDKEAYLKVARAAYEQLKIADIKTKLIDFGPLLERMKTELELGDVGHIDRQLELI